MVASGLCKKCEIGVAYAIGVAKPLSIYVDSFGTGKYEDEKLIGIDEQMKALREDNSLKSLFANNDFRGANPNIAGDNREKPKGLFDAVIKREDQEEKFNPWG